MLSQIPRTKGKKKSLRQKNTSAVIAKELVVIPRSFGFAPPRIRVNLRFAKTTFMSNVTSTTTNIRFNPSYVYDVDPALASTALPGFTEWAGLYRLYRTRSSRITVDFSSQENFSGTCAVVPINNDPGQNHVASFTARYLAQPISRQKVVGSVGGMSHARISHYATTASFGGSADAEVEDNFSAPTSGGSAPNNSWYWDVIYYTGFSPIVNGVFVNVVLDVEVEFSELANPST
jgi:hypothetical protein